jgi:hypothetical protein
MKSAPQQQQPTNQLCGIISITSSPTLLPALESYSCLMKSAPPPPQQQHSPMSLYRAQPAPISQDSKKPAKSSGAQQQQLSDSIPLKYHEHSTPASTTSRKCQRRSSGHDHGGSSASLGPSANKENDHYQGNRRAQDISTASINTNDMCHELAVRMSSKQQLELDDHQNRIFPIGSSDIAAPRPADGQEYSLLLMSTNDVPPTVTTTCKKRKRQSIKTSSASPDAPGYYSSRFMMAPKAEQEVRDYLRHTVTKVMNILIQQNEFENPTGMHADHLQDRQWNYDIHALVYFRKDEHGKVDKCGSTGHYESRKMMSKVTHPTHQLHLCIEKM